MFDFQPTSPPSAPIRTGIITTSHGPIRTPVFMPVGTVATVKSLSPADLESLGAQIILANNYHLYLRPGPANVARLGGLHRFMNWPHPILTDSGGFQIQSLGDHRVGLCRIDESGATFRSHLDGSTHHLTPESATIAQLQLGADIIMAFDHSTPAAASQKQATDQMHRTHRWLDRCLTAYQQYPHRPQSALFGIIQGGDFPTLRRQSAQYILSAQLPGIAIGGASIGADPHQTAENIAAVKDLLPPHIPLYAMGVGVYPSHAQAAVKAGADMFDCVSPTRLARCGQLYHPDQPKEYLDISKSVFLLDQQPILSSCDCYTCQSGFTRAYLHHLFKSRELLYYRLASIHNLRVMIKTVSDLASVTTPTST